LPLGGNPIHNPLEVFGIFQDDRPPDRREAVKTSCLMFCNPDAQFAPRDASVIGTVSALDNVKPRAHATLNIVASCPPPAGLTMRVIQMFI
jgi:hypothetical protein